MRAVAMDMDGTFLRPDSTYDRPRFERLLGRLRELDVRLVIASGNQVDRLREYFDPTDGLFYVSENGHYIHEGQNASPLFAAPRLGEAATAVIDVLEHIAAPYLVSTRAGAFMPAWASRAGLPWAQKYYLSIWTVERH